MRPRGGRRGSTRVPTAPLRPCTQAGCPALVGKGYCPTHALAKARTRYNVDTRKWYYTKAWAILREVAFARQPVCAECRTQPSTVVDHKVPHRGDRAMFYDSNNLQGLCVACHGRKTARGE